MDAPKIKFHASPLITPSSVILIFSALGTFGSPGISIILPQTATMKPAPVRI